ncbi:PepSY domain-containing protein [Methylobacillus flagellatus]|uniref:PepSY-associated TM helix domain-containing protein n=1 Tax=Methylobacillus flagellatus TaxID=405 RepID=UPI0028540122|nr:PepSY-associated TM helix domain-containing protein [Methylobacillus flagellatus]MDR5171167.1 PepSY domain-containing protein [Methylobacillus flagellatus]
MKKTFSLSMAWLHTWFGLYLGWLLFAVFLTGTMAVFEHSITHWMQPEASIDRSAPLPSFEKQLEVGQAYLEQHALREKGSLWRIIPAGERHPTLDVGWRDKGKNHEVALDPYSGQEIDIRETEGGEMLTHFHYTLLAGIPGTIIVGLAAVVMLVGLISGIVIHKRIFKDFFTFRKQSSSQRSWLDAHNVAGVMMLPFLLMITYTGLVMQPLVFLPLGIKAAYEDPRGLRADAVQSFDLPYVGEQAALLNISSLLPRARESLDVVEWVVIKNGGDASAVVEFYESINHKISAVANHAAFNGVNGELIGAQTEWRDSTYIFRAFVGTHVAVFGGWTVSWLYFIGGTVSCGLIATGLVLFTIKRRKRPENEFGAASGCVYRLIEALNVAAVMGSINAILIYFWANRILPADLAGRSDWEVRAFLFTWLASLAHALVRKPLAGWRDQLVFAVALCWLLPVYSWLSGQPNLLSFLQRGDGVALGVESTIVAFGVLLAVAVPKVSGAMRGVPARRKG